MIQRLEAELARIEQGPEARRYAEDQENLRLATGVDDSVLAALGKVLGATPDQGIINELLTLEGYPSSAISDKTERLLALPEPIASAFGSWIVTNTFDGDLEVAGFTLGDLVDHIGMKPPDAFLALEWLSRDPSAARRSLLPIDPLTAGQRTSDSAQSSAG